MTDRGQPVSDERDEQRPDQTDVEEPRRPAPRNPFAEPDERDFPDDRPALITTRKSAAISGVVVGLVALLFFVLICVAASMAFG
jgi:hypothetical protein